MLYLLTFTEGQGCIKCRRPDITYSGQFLIFGPYPGQIEKVVKEFPSFFIKNFKNFISKLKILGS